MSFSKSSNPTRTLNTKPTSSSIYLNMRAYL